MNPAPLLTVSNPKTVSSYKTRRSSKRRNTRGFDIYSLTPKPDRLSNSNKSEMLGQHSRVCATLAFVLTKTKIDAGLSVSYLTVVQESLDCVSIIVKGLKTFRRDRENKLTGRGTRPRFSHTRLFDLLSSVYTRWNAPLHVCLSRWHFTRRAM